MAIQLIQFVMEENAPSIDMKVKGWYYTTYR
jgi:hypothetical protein